MAESLTRTCTIVLIPTTLTASLLLLAQSIFTHATAYNSAPRELGAFLTTLRDAATETATYERDVSRVVRVEDKVRLGTLLREIQRAHLSLSNDLALMLEGDQEEEEKAQSLIGLPHIKERVFMPVMKTQARLFWRLHRFDLQDRLRRIDTLKLRFLVVYMGAIAATTHAASVAASAAASVATGPITPPLTPRKDDRMILMQSIAASAAAAGEVPRLRSVKEPRTPNGRVQSKKSTASIASITRPHTPPHSTVSVCSTPSASTHERFRRSPTRSVSSVVSAGAADPKTDGWSGVVAELQKSPRMEARRESIETAMRSLPF